MNSLETRYRRAFIHLENGDTSFVTSVLNSIPDNFSLTIEQSNIHLKYEVLLDVLTDLKVSYGSAMTLDSTQIADLLDIYDDETLPGIYARNILVTAGYLTYQEPYLFPDNLKKMEVKPNPKNPSNKESSVMRVFPNPAGYYTIVEFDVTNDEIVQSDKPQVLITIRDVRGNALKMLKSLYQMDQLVLDVRDLKPGLYFIELSVNGQSRVTVKMIVNH